MLIDFVHAHGWPPEDQSARQRTTGAGAARPLTITFRRAAPWCPSVKSLALGADWGGGK